jgi:hypothetical protein
MNFNIDPVDDVFYLFEVKTHLLTPECDCFTDLKIMILRNDKINAQKKIELDNSIKLYGGGSFRLPSDDLLEQRVSSSFGIGAA